MQNPRFFAKSTDRKTTFASNWRNINVESNTHAVEEYENEKKNDTATFTRCGDSPDNLEYVNSMGDYWLSNTRAVIITAFVVNNKST
jgi:hypothetical protein